MKSFSIVKYPVLNEKSIISLLSYIFVSNSKGVMSSMTSSFLVSFMIASIFFFYLENMNACFLHWHLVKQNL